MGKERKQRLCVPTAAEIGTSSAGPPGTIVIHIFTCARRRAVRPLEMLGLPPPPPPAEVLHPALTVATSDEPGRA